MLYITDSRISDTDSQTQTKENQPCHQSVIQEKNIIRGDELRTFDTREIIIKMWFLLTELTAQPTFAAVPTKAASDVCCFN